MLKQWVCGAVCISGFFVSGALFGRPRRSKKPQNATASIIVETGKAGCSVDVDSTPSGTTGLKGNLTVRGVEPNDHYVHVHCPDEVETSSFVSPQPGGKAVVQPKPPGVGSDGESAALQVAESKMELQTIVRRAADERAEGRFDEAVKDLRYAATLDPENPDLHRELGITFLLEKDWQRARIEILEALRHDPNDADAHSNLGYTLERLGKYKAALDQYRIATHLDPAEDSYRQHYLEALEKYAVQQAAVKQKKK
ncbi:MAG: tetratricopeptide repeat protein [Terriglobia bacterium]